MIDHYDELARRGFKVAQWKLMAFRILHLDILYINRYHVCVYDIYVKSRLCALFIAYLLSQ